MAEADTLAPAPDSILGIHAVLCEPSAILQGAETHANSKGNVEEEQSSKLEHHMKGEVQENQMSKTEHLCSTSSRDSWSEAAEESLSLSDHLQSDSESECSDVDLDNNWVESEHCDSDGSIESLKSRKQNKWLLPFFNMLDDAASDPTIKHEEGTLFYCPACRGSGLGETDVYKGLKPLIAHAKHHTKRRVKLHREFAAILEEDLYMHCNVTTEPCGGNAFSKHMGLIEDKELMNPLIVWPPMVLVQTKGVERVVVGSKEYLEVFMEYHPRRVRHAYDSEGRRGLLSLLVFLDSPVGYMHAKRLVRNFKLLRRGRKQWDELEDLKLQSCCGGLPYGYMATEEDMLIFNTRDASKKKVKWDLKRYQEAVIQPMVEMQEAYLENKWLKAKLLEQEEHNKFLEKVVCKLYAKMELKEEEVCSTHEIARKQDGNTQERNQ